ncbi:uncharacterized protein EDB91DRAFT_1249965 [Suillus paluster]|uniref:uncharacterized protein n=1 Tax=Suillus paluster TaxID=48578 RepID=UPI001B87B4C6|nr:uncharacterized protein EDB91DRAFT_1249965 [Suillus paluster]KAG1736660.1 hypothetical protein EDB91DRAFT_1249965 [Suillus paluster]
MNPNAPGPQLPQPNIQLPPQNPQLPPQDPQLPPPDPQLLLPSPHDAGTQHVPISARSGPASTQPGPMSAQLGPASAQPGQPSPASAQLGPASAQPGPASTQLGPASTQPGPASAQLGPASAQPGQPGPVSAQHTPPSTLYPPPSQHPPPHFTGAGGNPIDDPDDDLYDDNSPFSAPLSNALDMLLGGDVNMYDNNDGMEFDSFRLCVISLDSPPKVTSLSAKLQSSGSSKKKRSLVADMEDNLSILNNNIWTMSEHQRSRNEHYTMKMNYQAQKKDIQWHCESLSHKVLMSATTHQCKQEAKDKEILHLQAAAALQEREAETWCLKIQYKTMMHAMGASPSSSSPSG